MDNTIKNFLKTIPIPICGLILGTVSLGNLLFSEGFERIGNLFCYIGLVMMIVFLFKIIFTFKDTIAALRNPIVASVAPTFTMALMVIAAFLERLFPQLMLNDCLWLTAIILHLALMGYFITVHILPVEVTLEYVYPSWFITFVGIGVIPNTSSTFVKEIGEIAVWVALISYLILLPIMLKRIVHKKRFEDSAIPLITIMTAPGSLCLAGYLSVCKNVSFPLVILLLLLSQLIYLCIVLNMKKMLKVGFYPSYAAFTFPLVISATAIFKASKVLENRPFLFELTQSLSIFETILAILVVCYVLIKYFSHLYTQTKTLKANREF
ncbi:TDT family transporter [Enterococcus sp. DIV0756]|uniref:TDT family transporter n=1 Tax=Enterococcus sp. DIV0756 TaxID=2774636 RepID=UPI003F24FB03